MTRTDAFVKAAKIVIESRKGYIDSFDVRSIQLTITLDKEGRASVVINQRSEDVVMGCLEGPSRISRFDFTT